MPSYEAVPAAIDPVDALLDGTPPRDTPPNDTPVNDAPVNDAPRADTGVTTGTSPPDPTVFPDASSTEVPAPPVVEEPKSP